MDIRVAAYSPSVTVSTVSKAGNPLATAYVQNAAQSSPVAAAAPVGNATQSQQLLAANPNDGYTDTVRGSLINILA